MICYTPDGSMVLPQAGAVYGNLPGIGYRRMPSPAFPEDHVPPLDAREREPLRSLADAIERWLGGLDEPRGYWP